MINSEDFVSVKFGMCKNIIEGGCKLNCVSKE